MSSLRDISFSVKGRDVGLSLVNYLMYNINKEYTREELCLKIDYNGTPLQFAKVMSRLRKKYDFIVTNKINNKTFYSIKK